MIVSGNEDDDFIFAPIGQEEIYDDDDRPSLYIQGKM